MATAGSFKAIMQASRRIWGEPQGSRENGHFYIALRNTFDLVGRTASGVRHSCDTQSLQVDTLLLRRNAPSPLDGRLLV